jgi:ribonuclease HI
MAEESVCVVAAACDGACRGNPGPGGWGALLRFEDGSVRELGGAADATTNNRMELTAALALLDLLRTLPRHPDLVIRTDSRYLIDGLDRWMAGWKRKGWRTASGGPVLNRDLWERLDQARIPGVGLAHVRGHSGDPDNDRCDAIAVAFASGRSPRLRGRKGPGEGDGVPIVPSPAAAGLAPESSESPASRDPGDPAPPTLRNLLSRLELADRLATGGYGLTTVELARLVERPVRSVEARRERWVWRDWVVAPTPDGRWRLHRREED